MGKLAADTLTPVALDPYFLLVVLVFLLLDSSCGDLSPDLKLEWQRMCGYVSVCVISFIWDILVLLTEEI